MDPLVIFSLGLVFLTLIVLLGGSISYFLNNFLHEKDRLYAWRNRHFADWDKEGNLIPHHNHCETCNITVINMGGELVSHSSME